MGNGTGFQTGSFLEIDTTGGSTATTASIAGNLGIETAPVSEFPQGTAAARLAAFRTAVLANAPDISNIYSAAPRFIYTNRHGDALDLTFGLAGKINGVTVDYQSWPVLEDPWMYQAQNGHLHLSGPNRVVTSNYYDWTKSINNRPTPATRATTTLANDRTSLDFTYTRSSVAIQDGVTFTVEWSDTLDPGSWSGAGVIEQILSDNGTLQTMKASLPPGPAERRFARLRLSKP